MRLFPPKSAPKHTFHNFQLIELLRPRFVRLLPLLSTSPLCLLSSLQWAQGRKQFMNILQNEVCRLAWYTLEREIICLVSYGLYMYIYRVTTGTARPPGTLASFNYRGASFG